MIWRKVKDKAALYALKTIYGRNADLSCAYFGPDDRLRAQSPGIEDVGIVFQGPITNSIRLIAGLEQYRRLLPDARMVVSTWTGQKLDQLKAAAAKLHVRILESEPPQISGIMNVNKQIISTAYGIEALLNDFPVQIIAKARTDYFPWRPDRAFATAISLERLLGGHPRIWGLDLNTRADLPFSFADIFQVARTDAMRKYWRADMLYEKNISPTEFISATNNQQDQSAILALEPGEIFLAKRYLNFLNCDYDFSRDKDYYAALAEWFGILESHHIELSFSKYSNFFPGLEPPHQRRKQYMSLARWLENLENFR